MYSVVGCSACEALWIVADRPETTNCPRCRTRHQFDRLKKFVTTEEKDEAREVRAAMLADRQDAGEAYGDLESVDEMESILEEAGIEDSEYLQAKGVDPAEAEAAGNAATEPRSRGSRRDRVLDTIRDLEEPTEAAIVQAAADRGVPAEYTRSLLAKLSRNGDLTQTDDGYRLL
jgi:hypothetical protein